jgi:carbon storage regulator CsrA
MLILSLKVGESIYIDDDTTITLVEKWTGEVALQIDTREAIIILPPAVVGGD